ncbi:MAG: M48 family metallopeptidase [Comamonas sp.]
MKSQLFVRLSALIVAFSGISLLQGCANTTQAGAVGINRTQLLVVPSAQINQQAAEGFSKLSQEAAKQSKLNKDAAMTKRVRGIGERLIKHVPVFREDAAQWAWEINVFESDEMNAFCAPGGKIGFYTGIIRKLQLTDDEIAAIMGHEMAHALREHSREQLAKNQATSIGISLGAQLLGLGDIGSTAARLGGQLLSLKFSRNDESDADLVGLELAARAGYNPQAAVSLWRKMGEATGEGGIGFLSTHPTGPSRIRQLEGNVPRVMGLYEQARKR